MTIQKIIEDLKEFEGYRSTPYRCTAGKLTIGYGRNLEDTGLSTTEAEILLFFDLVRIMSSLDAKIKDWQTYPLGIQCVLIQMSYQLGVNGLLSFKKFLQAIADYDYKKAVSEMYDSKWARQTPMRVRYLANIVESYAIDAA